MEPVMYRYEVHCYSPALGEMFSEESGWYKDLTKCTNHCIARVNGNALKKEMIESDCPYGCLIEIYVVTNQKSLTTMRSSFSSYNVIKRINSMIDPSGYNEKYEFEDTN